MFSKFFGRSNKGDDKKEEMKIDLSFGYPRLDEFKNYLTKGKYDQFESEYELLQWDAKTLLNEGIGLNKDCAADIERWVKKRPDSYVANLFAGVSKTCLAWIARSAKVASSVSEESANQFVTLLDEAADYLIAADKINPDDAEICARAIRVFMGLGVAEENVWSYFNAAASLIPDHLMAHLMMINYLNPKWRGSLEAMHDFANQRVEDTGSSLLITLKLFAITEEWLYYNMNDEMDKYRAFFKQESVQANITALFNNYSEEESGALLIPYVYNYFAFLFWQMGNKDQARALISKIPGKMTVYPWAYMNIDSNAQLQQL
jgi:hypothetical protein